MRYRNAAGVSSATRMGGKSSMMWLRKLGRLMRLLGFDLPHAAYAPRAELVQNDFAPRPVGDAFGVQMPDGRHVRATVRYAVVGQNDLPLSGNHIGDARYVAGDKHWYVWLIQSANSAPAWIDP